MDGKLQATSRSGSVEEFWICLEQIVAFATGSTEVPPLGFDPKPSIGFQSECNLPSANTCANRILLQLNKMTYDRAI